MRIARFVTPDAPDQARVGLLVDDRMFDVGGLAEDAGDVFFPSSIHAFLAGGATVLARAAELVAGAEPGAGLPLADVRFLPPIDGSNKVLCVGKNYRTHLEELKRTDLIRELPEEPTGFVKLNDCLTGHETTIVRPPSVVRLDYEPELVFVIGKPAYRVQEADAWDHVTGITLLNDLTCRDTQKREVASGSRFWTAKNAPGFGPLGPTIVTMDEVPDPYDLWVTCSVNGEQRMRVNTSDQIWKLPRIVEHFSRLVPLAPGDMFSTGAPGGVAVGKSNAEALYLQDGDVVECAIEAPALTLRNSIVVER